MVYRSLQGDIFNGDSISGTAKGNALVDTTH